MNDGKMTLTAMQLRRLLADVYLEEKAAGYAADQAAARGDTNSRHFELGRGRAFRQVMKAIDAAILINLASEPAG